MGESLDFEYEESDLYTRNELWTQKNETLISCNKVRYPSITDFQTNEKRLKSIKGENIDIQFGSNLTRQDRYGLDDAKAITSITVKSKFQGNLNQLKKYEFEYDYFESSEQHLVAGQPSKYSDNARKRLRLKSL
ncbi:MAG: hypothetical protein AAGI25_20420 [Bacteroidota bacterium]